MKPIKFGKFMQVMRGGPGVEDLPVLTTHYEGFGPGIISCWKLSLRDLLRVLFTGRVYLVVLGLSQPAVTLSASRKDAGVQEAEAYYEGEA